MQIHVVQAGADAVVDWPGIRRFAGASRAVQWAYGAVPAGCGAGHFNFKTGIALHGAAGRHGILALRRNSRSRRTGFTG